MKYLIAFLIGFAVIFALASFSRWIDKKLHKQHEQTAQDDDQGNQKKK